MGLPDPFTDNKAFEDVMSEIEYVKITWQVEDGYSGHARPQYTSVRVDDFDDDASLDDITRILEEAVQDDFDGNVSWDSKNISSCAQQVKQQLEARKVKPSSPSEGI